MCRAVCRAAKSAAHARIGATRACLSHARHVDFTCVGVSSVPAKWWNSRHSTMRPRAPSRRIAALPTFPTVITAPAVEFLPRHLSNANFQAADSMDATRHVYLLHQRAKSMCVSSCATNTWACATFATCAIHYHTRAVCFRSKMGSKKRHVLIASTRIQKQCTS